MGISLPLRHRFGAVRAAMDAYDGFLGQLIYPVMSAMTIFPMPAFDMDSMLEMIRRWKIAFAGGAPQMMAALLSRPDIDRQDISSLRAWTTGGNPTPVALG